MFLEIVDASHDDDRVLNQRWAIFEPIFTLANSNNGVEIASPTAIDARATHACQT